MYLRDAETITPEEFEANPVIPSESKILLKDILSITVYTSDPESAIPYNLSANSSSTYTPNAQPSLQTYQVDYKGQINFPTLGLIKVSGMTLRELENFIQEKLRKYVKEEPIVSVKLLGSTFTIIGEVGGPGTYQIDNEKLNIIKALSMAGDVTNMSRLDNVKIFREDENGVKKIITINLNDKYLLFSPEYYVQHNDMIYVEAKGIKYLQIFNQQLSVYTYSLTFIVSIATMVMYFKK